MRKYFHGITGENLMIPTEFFVDHANFPEMNGGISDIWGGGGGGGEGGC